MSIVQSGMKWLEALVILDAYQSNPLYRNKRFALRFVGKDLGWVLFAKRVQS